MQVDIKHKEEREDDLRQLFSSILNRINDNRKKDKIIILDWEIAKAVIDYCNDYDDQIIYIDKDEVV